MRKKKAMTERAVMTKHTDIEVRPTASMDELITVLEHNRFAMPPHILAALRQMAAAGMVGIAENFRPENFKKLKLREQLDLMTFIMDRTYGKPDSAVGAASTASKTSQGGGDGGTGAAQGRELDAIAERAAKSGRALPEFRRVGGAATTDGNKPTDGDVVSMVLSPEQREARRKLRLAKVIE